MTAPGHGLPPEDNGPVFCPQNAGALLPAKATGPRGGLLTCKPLCRSALHTALRSRRYQAGSSAGLGRQERGQPGPSQPPPLLNPGLGSAPSPRPSEHWGDWGTVQETTQAQGALHVLPGPTGQEGSRWVKWQVNKSPSQLGGTAQATPGQEEGNRRQLRPVCQTLHPPHQSGSVHWGAGRAGTPNQPPGSSCCPNTVLEGAREAEAGGGSHTAPPLVGKCDSCGARGPSCRQSAGQGIRAAHCRARAASRDTGAAPRDLPRPRDTQYLVAGISRAVPAAPKEKAESPDR